MSLSSALARLGVPHTIRGPEPTSEADYNGTIDIAGKALPRVAIAGTRPIWADIEAVQAELASPQPEDVRAEASRRLQDLLHARNAAHLDIIIANANREAIRLLRKGEANWSATERARASALDVADGTIEAIRAASNALEAAVPVPADYAHDRHWPPQPS